MSTFLLCFSITHVGGQYLAGACRLNAAPLAGGHFVQLCPNLWLQSVWSLFHLDVSRGRHPYVVTQEIHKDEADRTPR